MDRGAIQPNSVPWVTALDGMAHAVRESENDHHSTHCGRYVMGRAVRRRELSAFTPTCLGCQRRLANPVMVYKGERVPKTVLEVQRLGGRRHNGKTFVE